VDPSTFKIGKAAQARALRDMAEMAEQLVETAAKSDAAAKLADSAHVQLRRFFDEQLPTFQGITEDYAKSAREKNEVEQRIASLDGKGDGGLRNKRQVQRDLRRNREDQSSQYLRTKRANIATPLRCSAIAPYRFPVRAV
jgi:hypothetical protein